MVVDLLVNKLVKFVQHGNWMFPVTEGPITEYCVSFIHAQPHVYNEDLNNASDSCLFFIYKTRVQGSGN